MPSWNEVEKNINLEIQFLKSNLELSTYHQNDPIKCNNCLFRYIAIHIVSGKIKARKVIYENNIIWKVNSNLLPSDNSKQHGKHWHYSTIELIQNYFKQAGLSTTLEPNLHYGRADLVVEKLNIFIEIGTIGLYKLYCNLLNMYNCKIIIVPTNDYILEFIL